MAIKQMNNNWELCLSFIKEHFSQPSTELIFVVFSTGGGSGSGIAPMLTDILMNELDNKTIVCCPILPSENESVIAHLNTLECLKELSELDVCILPIDNNKFPHLSKNELYKQVNHTFVDLISNILEQTDQFSIHGNLDKQDLITLFSQKGFSCISHVDLTNLTQNISLSVESVTESIQNSWNQSIFASPSYSKIIKFGLIFNGQESLMPLVKIKNILSLFNNSPLDTFEGWYTESRGDVFTIITGLEFNVDRLKQIEYKTTAEYENIQNALRSGHSISYKASNLNTIIKKKDKKTVSSILSKYQK
jgi:cell division GTPase FtsZ